MEINSIDKEWESFLQKEGGGAWDEEVEGEEKEEEEEKEPNEFETMTPPEPGELYISTKSKIAYLEQPIDLKIFWEIPVIPYATMDNGVLKKQIKINSKTPEELNEITQKLQKELYYKEHIITHIDNPSGRIKFKDIRKISIGLSKKDIISYRSKKKQAFYNCFVMIIRIKMDDQFREFHIKVFNTGKLEIPGVQTDEMFETVLKNIVAILQPFHTYQLTFKQISDTVLINSNFNCGFYINREVLVNILRNKYSIQCIYDSCSYPGIQCKFYYNDKYDDESEDQNGIQEGVQKTKKNKELFKNITEVSFMIFRTGSVLIVGMCNETVLQYIYNFVKNILVTEFKHICQKIIVDKKKKIKNKLRKKITIYTE